MRKALGVVLAGVVLACSSSARSPDAPVAFDASRARIYQPDASGSALSAASQASPVAVVGQFLASRGASAATVASLRDRGQNRSARSGLTHVKIEQEVGGLRVLGAYVKAATDASGQLKHVIDNSAPVSGAVVPAKVTEADALAAALAALHPSVKGLAADKRKGNVTTFTSTSYFYEPPTVERIVLLMTSGTLAEGFLVSTWTQADNLLQHTTVDGGGKVVGNEVRTANDSYRVFKKDPVTTPQEIVNGPGSTTASPLGWLSGGPQRSIDISGNNAHAFLDAVNDSIPDPGGTAILDGNFLALADLTVEPSTDTNRAVAVQNLFYLNNVVHDELYAHGFTEAAGNFQQNNFGRDTHDGDPVRAEAQDGGGTDNANFATPPDGHQPRMQMYLWTGKGTFQVAVDAPAAIARNYRAQGATFGPAPDKTGVTGDLVLVNDGTAPTTNGCEAMPAGSLAGKIALVDRGTCTFVTKALNAQGAGAIALVVANTSDSLITMGGTDPTVTIPAVLVSRTDGVTLRSVPGVHGTVRLTDPPPLHRDGDLDSDIVWHEYGHGLTWRMIDRMQGPLAGAVGEGMSDVLAIIINENDRVGEYAFDDPLGIRRAPYTNYPLTYGSVQGTEVHNDGEVYAAIGWRMFQLFTAAGIPKTVLLDEIVDGMNFTPSSPRFEDMRDGILASIANAGPSAAGHDCLVWRAFARYGVGVGASAQTNNGEAVSIGGGIANKPVPDVRVTESFALPASCQ